VTAKKSGIYSAILAKIFDAKYRAGMREVNFERNDMVKYARELGIKPSKEPR
jgi:hypothetical protein